MANLRTNLKRLRGAAGLTQEQLAARSGVSRPTIAVIESGSRTSTTSNTLDKLAAALKVEAGALMAAPKRAKRSSGRRAPANTDRDRR